MDFFNKAKQFAAENGVNTGGNANTNTNTENTNTMNAGAVNPTGAAQGNNAAGQSEDYGDKGLDFIEKKTGHVFSRDQNEKITDGARGMYEKATGQKIDPKYSN